jgi:hypothetical protein
MTMVMDEVLTAGEVSRITGIPVSTRMTGRRSESE